MNYLLTRDTKSSTKDSTALQKANVKVKMFRGINSVIYKKKKKKVLKVVVLHGCGVCPCGWVGLASLTFFWLGELVPVFC